MVAQIPANEAERVSCLRALRILDSNPDQEFTWLTQATADLLDMPICLISLIDTDRQWFKSTVGISVTETPRDIALCAHTILQEEPLIVHDASLDPRFSDNPMVTGDFHLRFYAGAPIKLDGHNLGSLCCIDVVPRKLSEAQIRGLVNLARQAGTLLEARRITDRLAESEERFHLAVSAMHEGMVVQDPTGKIIFANDRASKILGISMDALMGRTSIDSRWRSVHEDLSTWAGETHPAMIALCDGTNQSDKVMGIFQPSGELRWICINAVPVFRQADFSPCMVVCTFDDITAKRNLQTRIDKQLEEIKLVSEELEKRNRALEQLLAPGSKVGRSGHASL